MHFSLKLTAVAALATLSGLTLAQEQVVKIGHVGPVSGAIAHLGKDNEWGARLAIEELNAKGVSIGGKKAKFELLAEDDAGDPKQGTAAAQKLGLPAKHATWRRVERIPMLSNGKPDLISIRDTERELRGSTDN